MLTVISHGLILVLRRDNRLQVRILELLLDTVLDGMRAKVDNFVASTTKTYEKHHCCSRYYAVCYSLLHIHGSGKA